MMKGILQWLFFTLIASVLGACGGGGGGTSSPDPTPTPTNSAPVAPDVSGEVAEDSSRTITLPGTDADGDSLTYSKVTDPAHGTVTVSGNQATYTPAANYNGADNFTYKVNDGTADSNVATVSITVTPVNDAPTAGALSATTDEDVAKPITLTGEDVDTGDTLTYIKVSDPAHGTVSISGNVATYTPEQDSYYLASPDAQRLNGYFTVDSFTYKVSDGTTESAVATVSITVNPVNDAPVSGGLGSAQETDEDTPVTFSLPGYDPDQVSSSLSGTIITQPQHGSVSVNGKQATYTPAANYAGTDTFGYTLSDGELSSAESSITIVVGAVNDPPTAEAGADQEATEGETVNLSGSGSDMDSATLTYSWAQTDSSGITATLTGDDTATPSFTAPEVTADATLTFTLTVSDGYLTATDTVDVLVKNNPVVQPTPTGKLNDTGITTCSNDTQNGQTCPLLSHPNQDGDNGRDVTANDDSDGHAGFSFTKISNTGVELLAEATEWSCVKDNVTGLIWEVKTDDGGLHDKDDRYTWYEPDSSKNGGFAGYQKPSDYDSTWSDTICYGFTTGDANTYCNTKAYVDRVNNAGLCGATDWRMPSKEELRSIVSYDRYNPAIDTAWFPNTQSSSFWSASPYAGYGDGAWFVGFDYGYDGTGNKSISRYVRLVRSGQ